MEIFLVLPEASIAHETVPVRLNPVSLNFGMQGQMNVYGGNQQQYCVPFEYWICFSREEAMKKAKDLCDSHHRPYAVSSVSAIGTYTPRTSEWEPAKKLSPAK